MGDGDDVVVEHQNMWTTGPWKRYPESTQSFNGEAITGRLTISQGSSESDVRITGKLMGLPQGSGGIHIHVGCDVNNAATVGGHFYPEQCENPWSEVKYTGPAFDMDVHIEGVPWISTLGHVVVLLDSSGNRVAITDIHPMKAESMSGASLRLPPHLAFESWHPAVCQEDRSPFKGCAASATRDSCIGAAAPATTCRSDTRFRWCDQQASLILKVTREIDPCATMLVEARMHNPPFQQLDVHVVISGYGPDMAIEPTTARVQSGKASVLSSVENPKFTHFAITELGCTTNNELFDVAKVPKCGSVDELTWRGSCAGMHNEVVVELRPNIDLDSGSHITITGLVRSGPGQLRAPEIVPGPEFFSDVGIVEWDDTSGTLVLVILESDCLEPATMSAGVIYEVKLLFEMPLQVDSPLAAQRVRPSARASLPPSRPHQAASCTTDGQDMCLLPPTVQNAAVLVTVESPAPSFVVKSITQQTCLPGQCSRVTLTFAPNRHIPDSSYVMISGLQGLDMCSSCLPSGEECDASNTHDVAGITFGSLPLDDAPADADSNHRQLFQSLQDKNAEGSWEVESHRLVMKVAFGASLKPVSRSTCFCDCARAFPC